MPVERLRLKPWLKKEIDAGIVPGLKWVDRNKQIFQVAWKHASRHGWSLDTDACLFQKWAEHTGRFREGYDKPDPRRWKANFRCALNALPDIVEIPSRGQTRGRDAFKVYRMCEKADKKVQENRIQLTKRTNASSATRVPRTIDEDKEPSKGQVNRPFYAFPKPPYESNPFFGCPAGFQAYCMTAIQSYAHLPRDHDYVSPYYDQSGRPEMKDIGVMTYSGMCSGIKQEPPSPVGLIPSSCSKEYEQNRLPVVDANLGMVVKEEECIPSDEEIIDLVDQMSQTSDSSSSYEDLDYVTQSVPGSPVSGCPQSSHHGSSLKLKTERVSSYATPFASHSSLVAMTEGPALTML